MAQAINTGTTWSVASTYGASVNVTAATNAAECVVTLGVGHAVVVNDILHFSSGWARANDRLFRVKTVSTNDITLEGFNTTSTSNFPAGGGVGTIRRITAWTLITQVRSQAVSGGEQQYADGSYLENTQDVQIPTSKSPVVVSLTVAHDSSLAYRTTVLAAQDGGVPVGLRKINALGRPTYGAGFWSLQNVSSGDRGAVEESTVACSMANDVTAYAT